MLGKQEHMASGSCKFIHPPFRLRADVKNESCEILLPTSFAVLRDSPSPRNGKELFLRLRIRLLLRFIVLRPEWRTESTLINTGCPRHWANSCFKPATETIRWLPILWSLSQHKIITKLTQDRKKRRGRNENLWALEGLWTCNSNCNLLQVLNLLASGTFGVRATMTKRENN